MDIMGDQQFAKSQCTTLQRRNTISHRVHFQFRWLGLLAIGLHSIRKVLSVRESDVVLVHAQLTVILPPGNQAPKSRIIEL